MQCEQNAQPWVHKISERNLDRETATPLSASSCLLYNLSTGSTWDTRVLPPLPAAPNPAAPNPAALRQPCYSAAANCRSAPATGSLHIRLCFTLL